MNIGLMVLKKSFNNPWLLGWWFLIIFREYIDLLILEKIPLKIHEYWSAGPYKTNPIGLLKKNSLKIQ